VEKKGEKIPRLKNWEIVTDNLSKARLEFGLRFSGGFVKGERSGLQTRIATGNVTLCTPTKS
jgi:hypothetical protein